MFFSRAWFSQAFHSLLLSNLLVAPALSEHHPLPLPCTSSSAAVDHQLNERDVEQTAAGHIILASTPTITTRATASSNHDSAKTKAATPAIPPTIGTTIINGHTVLIYPSEKASPSGKAASSLASSRHPESSATNSKPAKNATAYPPDKQVKGVSAIVATSIIGGAITLPLAYVGIYLGTEKAIELWKRHFPAEEGEVIEDLIDVQGETISPRATVQGISRFLNYLMQREAKNPGSTFTTKQVEMITVNLGYDTFTTDRTQFAPDTPEWVLNYDADDELPTESPSPPGSPVPPESPPIPPGSPSPPGSPPIPPGPPSPPYPPWWGPNWWDPSPPDSPPNPPHSPPSPPDPPLSEGKGKEKATARDTDTDYKTNWYSKTWRQITTHRGKNTRSPDPPTLTTDSPDATTTPRTTTRKRKSVRFSDRPVTIGDPHTTKPPKATKTPKSKKTKKPKHSEPKHPTSKHSAANRPSPAPTRPKLTRQPPYQSKPPFPHTSFMTPPLRLCQDRRADSWTNCCIVFLDGTFQCF